MSTDLQNPIQDIARGELSALGVACVLCSFFVVVLGAGVKRGALLCDLMISERVSLTKLVFLAGLYVSCLSSILSSTLGTSRVVQGIAAEGLIPALTPLAQAESGGTDKNPLKATILVTVGSVLFLFLGNLNKLAILSSIPFLVTYAFVNYAYVSLAMSADFDTLNEEIATKSNYGSMQFAQSASTGDVETPRQTLQKLFSGSVGDVFTSAEIGNNRENDDDITIQPRTAWYSKCINRYVSFAAAIVHVLVVVFIDKWFALLHLVAFVFLYINIGQNTSPAFEQGVSQFSILHMIRVALRRDDFDSTLAQNCGANAAGGDGRAVVAPSGGPADTGTARFETAQLNDSNADFSLRKNYHYAEQVASNETAQ